MRFAAAIACVLVLAACVYLPRTTSAYDEDCQVETRHMRLEATQIGAIGSCTNRDCAYVLVAIGAVAAATAVVSGSIVLVGNVVYWLERQGKCALA